MKNKHVKQLFLDWSENRLNAAQLIDVEAHLPKCTKCRLYYELMSQAIEPAAKEFIPNLAADPYLSTKIKARVNSKVDLGRAKNSPNGWSRKINFAFSTLMLSVALFLGIYLGKGLATKEALSEPDIINGYYQVFFQESAGESWEQLLENQNGDRK